MKIENDDVSTRLNIFSSKILNSTKQIIFNACTMTPLPLPYRAFLLLIPQRYV